MSEYVKTFKVKEGEKDKNNKLINVFSYRGSEAIKKV